MIKLQEVKDYWNKAPCDTRLGKQFEFGSKEFFESIENERYSSQAFIHQFVQFSRWHGKKVLEIGCGIATDGLQFVRSGAEYIGIDASETSLLLANKRVKIYELQSEYNFVAMDAEQLYLPENSFDLVYSWGVIHHSPSPDKVVDEIYRVLKNGGLFRGMIYHRFSTMGFAVWLRDIKRNHNPFISLTTAFSRSLESPGTKAYSFVGAKKLFEKFKEVKITPCFSPEFNGLKNTPFLPLLKYYPNGLASWLAVEGVKK